MGGQHKEMIHAACIDIGKGKLRLKIQQGLFRYWIHSTKQETQARTKWRHCNTGPLTHWCIYQMSFYCDGSNLASLVLPAITMYLMGHSLLSCECRILRGKFSLIFWPHCSLQSKVVSQLYHHPSLPLNIWTKKIPVCVLQQHGCLIGAQNLPAFSRRSSITCFQMCSPIATSIPMNSANNKQRSPQSTLWFTGHLDHHILCPCADRKSRPHPSA